MTMNEKRMKQYPDTKYFKYFNANPKGRITTDCVIRAVAKGLGTTWEVAFDKLSAIARKDGYTITSRQCFDKLLKKEGWVRMKQPKHDDGTKVTCEELIDYYSQFAGEVRIIASVGAHHINCIVNANEHTHGKREYKVHDIWNSSNEKVGVYYISSSTVIEYYDS